MEWCNVTETVQEFGTGNCCPCHYGKEQKPLSAFALRCTEVCFG